MKRMKKWILLTVVMVLPLTMLAQDDDMYFVPTKENVAKEKKSWGMPADTYYSGSNRSVDDYNHYKMAPSDSVGNDIINFSAVRGVYPDSTYMDSSAASDYQYTRRLSRFDDYSPSEIYWEGYRDGRWSSPWYYSSAYYPWYDPWYDPWYTPWYDWRYHYYGWGWGWYSGYYYPWYRYHRPYYYVSHTYRHGGSYRGYRSNNTPYARSQRRNVERSRDFGRPFGGSRNNSGSNRTFGGGGGSSRSYGGGGSFGGGSRGGGGGSRGGFGSRR